MKAFLPLLALFFSFSSLAQLVRGRVMTERGTNAAHITVSFRNTANAVISRADGSFDIRATSLPDTLVFSAAGFEPYEVVVTEKTIKDPNFEVVLLDARGALSEVVVTVPYGTVKRSREVGSSTTRRKLEARVAGVDMSAPHASSDIAVRGYASLGETPSARYATDKKLNIPKPRTAVDSVAPRSKLLSAGEVNDFNKWKMWEDFNADAFKTWSGHWNLHMRTRYSVQLVNVDNTAIIGQRVYLVNRTTRDTVWSAVSDNTGKAELWAGLHGTEAAKEDYIIVSGSESLRSPSPFVNGMNRMRFANPCNLSNRVEIAFVVDATGSMQDEIEFLKLELEDVISQTFADNKELDLNVGSVFYRDQHDEYLTKHIPLNNDLLKVLNFIKLQSANGGGDEPEAVHEALRVALDSLQWSSEARSRLLFFILDAPPHDSDRDEVIRQMKRAAAMGVRIIPVSCSGGSKSAEYLMRCMALATNGTYAFLTDHSGIGGAHIEATTDAFTVESLNGLMQRLIRQMIYAVPCTDEKIAAPVVTLPVNTVKVKIYPNPTRGNLVIESEAELKQVYITDFTGKILMNLTGKGKHSWSANISQYPAATYLVKYVTKDDQWGGEKIVKVH